MESEVLPVVGSVLTPEGYVQFNHHYVVCYCGKKPWCEHVESLLRSGADSLSCFFSANSQGVMSVPLFPSQGVWADVLYRETITSREDSEAYQVSVVLEKPSTQVDNFLGIVSDLDTIQGLRLMIQAWFERQAKTEECNSGVHSWRESKILERATKIYLLANEWNITWTGSCLACSKKVKENWNDLIPDEAPSRSWSNGGR